MFCSIKKVRRANKTTNYTSKQSHTHERNYSKNSVKFFTQLKTKTVTLKQPQTWNAAAKFATI